MTRFLVPAAASVAAGLALGAAAVFGATLVAQGDPHPLDQRYEQSVGANQVQYGDRCDDDDDEGCFMSHDVRHDNSILP
jgi:Protein of unknown function (DUF2613)